MRPCRETLLEGLRKLEYRGYDSAGLAWRDGTSSRRSARWATSTHSRRRSSASPWGRRPRRPWRPVPGSATRWATHGAVMERNAHPHHDTSGRVQIVLIENHLELRERLAADLVTMHSDTDAEVVAHLIALHYDGSPADAVRRSLDDLTGHFAFVAMCQQEPDTLVGVKRECPLVVGIGEEERFIASSISALRAPARGRAARGYETFMLRITRPSASTRARSRRRGREDPLLGVSGALGATWRVPARSRRKPGDGR